MFYGTEMCYNLSPYANRGSGFKAFGHTWINNGKEEKFVSSVGDLEDEWEIGRLPVGEETRQKMQTALLNREDNPFKRKGEQSMSHGRVWVTTPERDQERYLKPGEEAPEGWEPGRMKRPPRSQESRDRTRQALKGKEKSPEHRQKLRESTLAYYEKKRSLPAD